MLRQAMKTPLYDAHLERGARMGAFAGWDMPIQYEGILKEHARTREGATLFDICHMGEFEMNGPTARADLERLLTLNVGSLEIGQCRYGYLLDEQGGVLDDLTCYRRGPDRYFLVVNAGTTGDDAAWIRARLQPETRFQDLSPVTAKLDVQGPQSRAGIEAAFGQALPELGYFRFAEVELMGRPVLLSRTGYTGEWGYELYLDAAAARDVWDGLLESGEIRPAGLGARDTLRLEMGYPLYGHELGRTRTPVAAARGSFIHLGQPFFGREAVRRDLQQGVPRYLAGLRLEGRQAAREGAPVYRDEAPVGEVTSGALAPSLGVAVAMAYVDAAWCAPGTPLAVEVRGKRLAAEVVELPFYREGTARGRKKG